MKKLFVFFLLSCFVLGLQVGSASAAPVSERAYNAAYCAEKIVTVLDAEAVYDDELATSVILTMSPKCLSIGADAEDDRDSYLYTDEEILKRMVAKIRSAYRVSASRFWNAYNDCCNEDY